MTVTVVDIDFLSALYKDILQEEHKQKSLQKEQNIPNKDFFVLDFSVSETRIYVFVDTLKKGINF